MKVESRLLASIRPYERNPRQNDGAVENPGKFPFREFGLSAPVVVDPDGVIICGTPAGGLAYWLGLHEAPSCNVARGLTPARARERH